MGPNSKDVIGDRMQTGAAMPKRKKKLNKKAGHGGIDLSSQLCSRYNK
jgi:hypothetical protein